LFQSSQHLNHPMKLLFRRFCRFSKPNPRTTAIPVDELDAGQFQGPTNGQIVRRSHGRLSVGQLGAANRGNAE
jgi:hypothetical protein